MIVFVCMLLIPILIQNVAIKNKKINFEKKNKTALLFFFVWFTLLVALRHECVGNDTRNYIRYFNLFSDMAWKNLGSTSMEVGYAVINKTISLIFKNHQIFLAILAIATSMMIYPTYKRLCVDASLTIVLFGAMPIFVMMFSGIRQVLAMGIGFIAYECTRQKKKYLFLLSVLFAVLFHTSAFILLLMYPIYHARITKKWLYAVVPAMALVFLFNEKIFLGLGMIINRFVDYDITITRTGAYTMLMLFAFFAVLAFLVPDEHLLDDETRGMRNLLLLSVVLQMFAPLHRLAMRFNYYYIIFIPLLIPMIIRHKSERMRQVGVVARYVMLAFFFGYFFISIRNEANLNVFPYHFFWEAV